MRKWTWAAIATGLVAPVMFALPAAATSQSHPQPMVPASGVTTSVCAQNACLQSTLWNAGAKETLNSNGDQMYVDHYGTVSSSWPFNKSAWNSRYEGKAVYIIDQASNHAHCIEQAITASNFYVQEQDNACSGPPTLGTMWVGTSGGKLVSVIGTDQLGNNSNQDPVVMWAGCFNPGCVLYTGTNPTAAQSTWAY
jgi:hypothetical protein